MEDNNPIENYFFPMIVSSNIGEDDSVQEILSRWNRFDMLDENDKKILISKKLPVIIKSISIQFHLEPEEIGELSRLIREVYFKNISKSDLLPALSQKISSLDIISAQQISSIISGEIFNMVLISEPESELINNEAKYFQLDLRQAIAQYPKINEQIITERLIKLQNFSDSIRPSIKNWIKDFHDSMGAGKHSPIDRGNYLFHGENGKKLTAPERQKLGAILKSLDEQTLLTIDPIREVVVFENEARNETVSSVPAKTWIPDPVSADKQEVQTDNFADQRNVEIRAQVNQQQGKVVDLRPDFMSRPAASQSGMQAPQQTGPQQNEIPVKVAKNPVTMPSHETYKESADKNFVSAEFIHKMDDVEKFYDRENSVVKAPEKLPVADAFQKEKPPVVLKNISFSPNFVATPKQDVPRVENVLNHERYEKPLRPQNFQQPPIQAKEEVFSIPGSKPPMGTAEYDARKISTALKIEHGDSFDVPSHAPAQPRVMSQAEPVTKIETPAGGNLDTLSDEMLLKIYREKEAQKKGASPNFRQVQNFHIGANSSGNDNSPGNVVNLRLNNE